MKEKDMGLLRKHFSKIKETLSPRPLLIYKIDVKGKELFYLKYDKDEAKNNLTENLWTGAKRFVKRLGFIIISKVNACPS